MRFFWYSTGGDGICIARRLQRDGHDVDVYHADREARRCGAGLVNIVSTPEPKRGATVIIDGTGAVDFGVAMRRRGFNVLGGNVAERWETRRWAGIQAMRAAGVVTPPTERFTSLREAQAFLSSQPSEAFWFFKPDGLKTPKSMTRAGSPPKLLRWLTWAAPQLGDVPEFILQQKVDGTEVSCCVWLDGRKVVSADCTLEEKKFGVDDTGPATGCATNIVFDVNDRGALVQATMAPFIDEALASGYCGPLDLNSLVNEHGVVYGLEFTARLGWDCTQAWSWLFDHTLGEQLAAFAAGELTRWQYASSRIAMTVRLSVPPQPMEDTEDYHKTRGMPLDESLLDEEAEGRVLLDDVAVTRAGLVMGGGSGSIGVIGTVGDNLDTMRAVLRGRAESYKKLIDDLMFRPDPVSRAERDLDALAQLGLLPADIGRVPMPVAASAITAAELRSAVDQLTGRPGDGRLRHHRPPDTGDNRSPSQGITDTGLAIGDDINEASSISGGVDVAAPAGGTNSSGNDSGDAATP